MSEQEKVARWYFRQFAGEHDPSWDEIPQHARDNCFKAANELLALIQPGGPIGCVHPIALSDFLQGLMPGGLPLREVRVGGPDWPKVYLAPPQPERKHPIPEWLKDAPPDTTFRVAQPEQDWWRQYTEVSEEERRELRLAPTPVEVSGRELERLPSILRLGAGDETSIATKLMRAAADEIDRLSGLILHWKTTAAKNIGQRVMSESPNAPPQPEREREALKRIHGQLSTMTREMVCLEGYVLQVVNDCVSTAAAILGGKEDE